MEPNVPQVVLAPEVICRRLGPPPIRAAVTGTAALASAPAQSQSPRRARTRELSLFPAFGLAAEIVVKDLGRDPIYKGINSSVMPQFTVGLAFNISLFLQSFDRSLQLHIA